MKKIALVGSFCNTNEKVETLIKNIKELKSMGVDVMVISPISLPEEVLKSCDYFFLTKENPILNFPVKSINMWKMVGYGDRLAKMYTATMDYGWAGLYQIKKLSEVALSLEYDHFYHLIYDLVIDDFVKSEIISQKPFSFYPFIKYPSGSFFGFGLYFMSLSRENLSKVLPLINLDSYLSNPEDCAESFLHNAVMGLDGAIVEKDPVRDSINYWDYLDIFNHSPISGMNFFIAKDFYSKNTIKILFYSVPELMEIKVKIGEKIKEIKITDFYLLDLEIFDIEDEEIEIETRGESYNITPEIKKIINTYIEIQ